jgi:hypothetical protein
MVTPFLHTYVHKKKGGKIKYMFSKLIDGVHPTIDLSRYASFMLETWSISNSKNDSSYLCSQEERWKDQIYVL